MHIPELHKLFLQHPAVCTDTRKIEKGAIFFALKGGNFNGNKFAQTALANGCSIAIVDEPEFNTGKNTILVPDVLECLQQLAAYHRKYWNKKIVALTGSNGKTTTKELIYYVLKQQYNCLATVGNLNNHIGVPLTLLGLTNEHDIAVVEMGANHQKEIALLCNIAQPDYGVITNIGKAHLEGFGGEEGVLKGKGEMYEYMRSHNGIIFINGDDVKLNSISNGIPKITYGYSNNNKIHGKIVDDNVYLSIAVSSNNSNQTIATRLTGAYNGINVLCAYAVGLEFGLQPSQIKQAIESYSPDNNRSQIFKTNKNTLILDAYNANPSSMVLAIENLERIKQENKFFILGEMREMGQYAPQEHLSIIKAVKATGLSGIFIGREFLNCSAGYDYKFFETTASAIDYLNGLDLNGYTILIKGSRGIKLEDVTTVL